MAIRIGKDGIPMEDDTLVTKEDLAVFGAEMKAAIAQSKNTMVIWYIGTLISKAVWQ